MTRCVISWGGNNAGQCGTGENINDQLKPKLVEELLKKKSKPIKVVCGFEHTLCLTDANLIYSWGSGTYGAVGSGYNYHEWIPIPCDKGIDASRVKVSLITHYTHNVRTNY